MSRPSRSVGDVLREWRKRRRMSQLDLALEADVSARHLSFIESGRAAPSRDMLLHLAEHLEIPLRQRNVLLLAGGYAPVYPERPLDDPQLQAARHAVDLVLKGHEPYPALAVDRHWTLLSHNAAVPPLLAGVAPGLLTPPVNVLRLTLHPEGLASRIANLPQWRGHLLSRLRHQIEVSGDPVLERLHDELRDYAVGTPIVSTDTHVAEHVYADMVVPVQFVTDAGVLSLFSATTVFGTPVDVTLAEIALESFFPADAATAETLRRLAAPSPTLPR
jgi:transcriptional regulator with XRE-family HTH domain